jgi:hypothetical protein
MRRHPQRRKKWIAFERWQAEKAAFDGPLEHNQCPIEQPKLGVHFRFVKETLAVAE